MGMFEHTALLLLITHVTTYYIWNLINGLRLFAPHLGIGIHYSTPQLLLFSKYFLFCSLLASSLFTSHASRVVNEVSRTLGVHMWLIFTPA